MKKFLAAVLFALLLSGCNASTEVETVITAAEEVTTTETETTTATEASSATETSSVTETTTETEASTETTTADETEISFETTTAADLSDFDGRLYEWEFADELVIKDKNAFSEELLSAALDMVKGSDMYKRVSEVFAEAKKNDEGGYEFDIGGSRDYSASEVSEYFDKSGNILPKFDSGVTADFDGDGRVETFLLFILPEPTVHSRYSEELIFINSDGEAAVPENGDWCIGASLMPMRYNGFIHMGYDNGINIGTSHGEIYAVENGEAIDKATMFHIGSPYKKAFMRISCAQTFGCGLLFWNSELNAYCEINYEELTDEQAQALFDSEAFQSDIELTEKFTSPEQVKEAFCCSGGLSFHAYDDGFIVFLYENGVFTRTTSDDMIMPISFGGAVHVTGLNIEKEADNAIGLT